MRRPSVSTTDTVFNNTPQPVLFVKGDIPSLPGLVSLYQAMGKLAAMAYYYRSVSLYGKFLS